MKNSMKMEVIFNIKGLDGSPYEDVKGLKQAMCDELIRVYGMYADINNSGITDRLNAEFDTLYPTYFEDNKDKEWYDLTEYNKFMADGYQHMVVDEFNSSNESPILNFYVDPEEVVFTGYLKVDRNITVDFSLKPID